MNLPKPMNTEQARIAYAEASKESKCKACGSSRAFDFPILNNPAPYLKRHLCICQRGWIWEG
jgi:hypothetical protein